MVMEKQVVHQQPQEGAITETETGTSLVVQWLRIHPPMQGKRV